VNEVHPHGNGVVLGIILPVSAVQPKRRSNCSVNPGRPEGNVEGENPVRICNPSNVSSNVGNGSGS